MKLTANVKRSTGGARHFVGTVVDKRPVQLIAVPDPARVEIVVEGTGFLLLRLDASGVSIADTWHPTIDEAKRAARIEYCIEEQDWRTD